MCPLPETGSLACGVAAKKSIAAACQSFGALNAPEMALSLSRQIWNIEPEFSWLTIDT
jgi:hypothetical protein